MSIYEIRHRYFTLSHHDGCIFYFGMYLFDFDLFVVEKRVFTIVEKIYFCLIQLSRTTTFVEFAFIVLDRGFFCTYVSSE